jgi:hypothetical protein
MADGVHVLRIHKSLIACVYCEEETLRTRTNTIEVLVTIPDVFCPPRMSSEMARYLEG